MSVFKKLIRREFGKKKYDRYCETIFKNLANRKAGVAEIYADIYECCRGKDKSVISKMQEQLHDAMQKSILICRNFAMVFIFYAFSLMFLLGEQLEPMVAWIAGGAMTLAFLVKLYEYFVNRFCFIDAQIIVVYKEVLEKLLKGE